MANAHDLPGVAPGGDVKARRKRGRIDHQRVVARNRQRVIQPLKNSHTGVGDR
ncbi:hypothetical protein D3C81_2066320 [compost metagenome]